MIKKFYQFLLPALILSLIAFGSCTTHKQVACPPQKQNKHLARESSKTSNKRIKTRSAYHANKNRNNTANKYYKSRNKKLVPPEYHPEELVTDLTSIFSKNGNVEFEIKVKENLVASSNTRQSLNVASEITAISRLNEKLEASSLIAPIDLENRREQRKTNRKLKKELKKSLQVAQNDSQQSAAKPAMGLAIASLVLGITSFVIFAIPAGTLAIIFGAIALSRIKKNPDLPGRGMALAGMVLGIVGMGLWIILLLTA